MKKNWSEYICDYCGQAEHFLCNYKGQIPADEKAKKTGWIIKNKKHFCCQECYEQYKKECQRGT